MRCNECGCNTFRVSNEFVTEYHDASIKFEGILSDRDFELTPGTLKPHGSFYPQSIVFTCTKCGKQIKYDEASVDCPETVLAIIENYARKNVFGSN